MGKGSEGIGIANILQIDYVSSVAISSGGGPRLRNGSRGQLEFGCRNGKNDHDDKNRGVSNRTSPQGVQARPQKQ